MSRAEVSCNFHTEVKINWRYRTWESSKVLRIAISNPSLPLQRQTMDTDPHIRVCVSCQDKFLGEFARLHNGDCRASQNLNNSKLPEVGLILSSSSRFSPSTALLLLMPCSKIKGSSYSILCVWILGISLPWCHMNLEVNLRDGH